MQHGCKQEGVTRHFTWGTRRTWVCYKYRWGPYTSEQLVLSCPQGPWEPLLTGTGAGNLLKRCETRTTGLTSLIWKPEILNALKSRNADVQCDILSEILHSPSHTMGWNLNAHTEYDMVMQCLSDRVTLWGSVATMCLGGGHRWRWV